MPKTSANRNRMVAKLMKKSQAPRALGELIGSGLLDSLAASARAQSGLTDQLRKNLEPDLAPALLLATLHSDGTLVLTASSPAWAARMQFAGPQLLERCRELLPEARRFRVRTARDTGGA
ncbi:MAG: DUF721 domain-containing protein [Chromatiales bacterium]|nr:DUF721 domain-containing protein [Chromatiales bacterium]